MLGKGPMCDVQGGSWGWDLGMEGGGSLTVRSSASWVNGHNRDPLPTEQNDFVGRR